MTTCKDALMTKELTIQWLMKVKLIASKQNCAKCNEEMSLSECEDRSDGYRWQCRKQAGGRRHKQTLSIRKGSWFEGINLTIEEMLKYTYWWCQDLGQWQIRRQLKINPNTAVDWDSFCREICEVTMLQKSEKIEGPGKTVQIDESKVGKRKYHRGHRVEGQWVFGGIEEDTRKCFLVPVEDRSEATLLPIIREWIEPGTLIVSSPGLKQNWIYSDVIELNKMAPTFRDAIRGHFSALFWALKCSFPTVLWEPYL